MPHINHTPTPWRVGAEMNDIIGPPTERNPDGMIAAVRYLGNSDAAKGESCDNAAFIVQACNAHDALVEALRLMLTHEGGRHTNGIGIESDSEALETAKSVAWAALKLARGEA